MSFTYGQKWALMELFPIFVSVLLLIGAALATIAEQFKTKQALRDSFAKMGDVLVGGMWMSARSRRQFEVFQLFLQEYSRYSTTHT